jgi:hypothetical protein
MKNTDEEEELDLSAGLIPHHMAEDTPKDSGKLEKGAPVQVGNKQGKVVYVHDTMKIARVRFDNGTHDTVNTSKIKVLPHVTVQSHIRKVPSK